MSQRYHLRDGIIIRRATTTAGDVLVTLYNRSGKWRGIARQGKLLGGNLGRLSLFYDVTLQYYQKGDQDLPLITQVSLSGALLQLSEPHIYPLAHMLAELIDQLSVDVHLGERSYDYLASGLRGLSQYSDPEKLALIYLWKLVQQAGLAPRLGRCVHCYAPLVPHTFYAAFDIAAGGLTCASCDRGLKLSADVIEQLKIIHTQPVKAALASPLTERDRHWLVLEHYTTQHIGKLQSLEHRRLQDTP